MLIPRLWVCQAFLLLKGSARTDLNVHSSGLKIPTLKMQYNAVDVHFMRFSKAEEMLVGCSFEADGGFGMLMSKTPVCLAMDIVLLLLCPSAYS